jgi:hypothetical protein
MLQALMFAAKMIDIAQVGIKAGKDAVEVYEFLKKGNAMVKKMAEENRGPTEEERAALNAEIDANHADIQKL